MPSKKNHVLFVLTLLVNFTLSGQAQFKQLSKTEKLEDFNYLYNELKASYPYFGINKRAHNTDWLLNKDNYIKAIKKTENDIDFFKVFTKILNDLNNGHTDTYPTVVYDYFYDAYKYGVTQDSTYLVYLKELEKSDSIRANYWKEINRDLFFPELKNKTSVNNTDMVTQKNIETIFIDSLSIAIIKIKSFSYDYVEKDANALKLFFNNAYNYKNLIIDIQGNSGGSTEYWMQNMIPHLINNTINYPIIYGFKNCDRLKKFKPDYFKNTIDYKNIALPNMPKELKNGKYLFRKENISITPISDKRKYSGKIYLLVDHDVYSSSEALAYFCKTTGFATVVGEKTSGDGIGTDPLILTLPNSNIIIRFTGEMGLNPDGSANDETKTIPDLILKSTNKIERRKALLNLIKYKL